MSISENNLHFYFPMLRTRSQLLADIHASQSLAALFDSWIPEHQEDFLNFCTGVKGVKIGGNFPPANVSQATNIVEIASKTNATFNNPLSFIISSTLFQAAACISIV